MTEAEIKEKLTAIFRSVFDNPSIEISDTTTAKDIEGWDSLTHVDLIVAVEKGFKVSFTTKQVMALQTAGDLIRLIATRCP
jgi:acyl carrier protein